MNESQEQIALIDCYDRHAHIWPDLAYAFHVPNGELRHKATAGRLQRMGQRRGVPDLLLLTPRTFGASPAFRQRYGADLPARRRCSGLAIELKYGRNRPTREQARWLAWLDAQGYYTAVCYGWQEAWCVTASYLFEFEQVEPFDVLEEMIALMAWKYAKEDGGGG